MTDCKSILEGMGYMRFPFGMFSRVQGVSRNERIVGMSDAFFPIVLTLLVLELRVPDVPEGELVHALWEMVPEFVSYVGAFVVLGIYWVGHHNMFLHIKRHDRALLWLNILFLMLIASTPFHMNLMVSYIDSHFPVITFGATLIAAGLVLDFIWWYSTKDRHLVDANIAPELVAFVHRRVLTAPAIYLVAIGVSFASVLGAKLLVVLVALIYIFPNPLDRLHQAQLGAQGEAEAARQGEA